MGRVCICGSSAVEFWRLWRLFGSEVFRAWGVRPAHGFARDWRSCIVSGALPRISPISQGDLKVLTGPEDVFLSAPVDLFVSPGEPRNHSGRRATHLLPSNLPPGSLVRVGENLYVASPAYGLAWSASTASRGEMLRLIAEFCGSYVVDPGADGGFVGVPPLTSIAELLEFCLRAKERGRVRGVRALEERLRCAVDNCASPMEAAMVALLCASGRDGGYKFTLPAMNVKTLGDARIMDRSHYVGDAVWAESDLVLEYDSRAYHAEEGSVAHDKIRSMALEAKGYHVVSATPPMIMRPNVFHKVAIALAEHMGRRMRPERFDAGWWERCRKLRADLLDYPQRWYRLKQAEASV